LQKALQNWVIVVGIKEISQEFVSSLGISKAVLGAIREENLEVHQSEKIEWGRMACTCLE